MRSWKWQWASFFFLQKLYLWNSVWRSSSLCRTETWLGIFWQSVVFRVRGFWANITSLNRYSCSKKIFMQKQGTEEKSSQRDLSVLIRFWFLYRLNLWSGSAHHIKLAWTVILKNTPNISLSLRLAQLLFSVPVHLCMLYVVMIKRLWLKIRLVFGLSTRRYSNVQFGFWNQFVHLLTSPDVRRSDKISSSPFIGLNLSLFLSASM